MEALDIYFTKLYYINMSLSHLVYSIKVLFLNL